MLAAPHETDVDITELQAHEIETVRGGTIPLALQYATFYIAAFQAGFLYGYNELAPKLFG